MGGHEQLQVLPCPSCGRVGTLDLCTRLVAPEGGSGWPSRALARQVTVLACTRCPFVREPSLTNAVPVEYPRFFRR